MLKDDQIQLCNDFFSIPQNLVTLCNNALYDGKDIIQENHISEINMNTIQLILDQHIISDVSHNGFMKTIMINESQYIVCVEHFFYEKGYSQILSFYYVKK